MKKQLEKISEGKMIGGVVNGLAAYLDIDVTLLRVIFVAMFFVPHVPVVIAYIILWIVIPTKVQNNITTTTSLN